ncbi:methyltransferase [Rhodococcus aerolatus]
MSTEGTGTTPGAAAAALPQVGTVAAPLRAVFERTGYDADGVLALLGADAHAALGRGEAVPALRACADGGELGVLVRLLLLGEPTPAVEADAALAGLGVDRAVAAGLLGRRGEEVVPELDVRPLDTGGGTRWLFSDLDGDLRRTRDRGEGASTVDREHVLGVGQASLSLLRATPTTPAGTVLDLGTGCGVQAVHAAAHARSVTATDVSPRARALAAAGFALNEVDVELLGGSWFDEVAGRQFDRVVANPPFVVGPPRVEHTYRDSGLDLDGASALVVRGALDHLAPGGTASLLAAWVHTAEQPWEQRVGSWLPGHGVDAWVAQRDVADPALYVGTWLRDAGVDVRTPAGAARADAWLAHLERAGVAGVGFGFVTLRRTDEASDVLCEDLRQAFDDPLGDEAWDYLARLAWVREHDVLDDPLVLAPGAALERVATAGPGGWEEQVVRVHRADGPRWSHEVDALGAALLGGLGTGSGLAAGELVGLLGLAHDEPAQELAAAARTLLTGLLRHGVVRPA